MNAEDGDGLIHRLHFAANCLTERTRVRSRPEINNRIIRWGLGLGEIDKGRAGHIEAVAFYVTDDADNGDVSGGSLPARRTRIGGCEHDSPSPRQLDMLTDRIAVFPIFALQRFVDHRDPQTC